MLLHFREEVNEDGIVYLAVSNMVRFLAPTSTAYAGEAACVALRCSKRPK